MQVKRTEQIWVKPSDTISHLCHISKNLYNEANYLVRQEFFNNGRFIGYNQLDKLLNGGQSENYKTLSSGTSQGILRLLDKSWKSFFRAIKNWKKNPDKYLGRPKPPKYKKKDGEHLLVFTNQQCEIEDGYLCFPKKSGVGPIKTRLGDVNLREVRVIPKGVGYIAEIVYEKEVNPEELSKERIAGIDLGSRNIVTIANNIGENPIIVKDNGDGIKSIQQFYNRAKAKVQRIYSFQQGREPENVRFGKRMKGLQDKREKKAKNYIHKLSRFIVDWCKSNHIGVLVIGYNPEWKQRVNIGKVNNQSFVQIPHWDIIQKIQYKAEEEGIDVILHEESHTSKCSFFDSENIEHQEEYVGKRKSRGLFRTATGKIVNADVNGALNIITKVIPDAFQKGGRIGGCGTHPSRINIWRNQTVFTEV